MSEQRTPYPEAKVIRRFSMWAADPGAAGQRVSMDWQMKGSNLELIVWLRSENEKGKPPIRANLNTTQGMMLVDMIRQVAAMPGKGFMDLPVKNMRKINKDDPDSAKEMYDQARVRVVKTTEGVVQIGIFDPDESRTRVLFPFTLDRWTGNLIRNGEAMDQSEVSVMVAKQYANILNDILAREMEITTKTENSARYPSEYKGKTPYKKPNAPSGGPSAPPAFDDIAY